MTDNHDRVWDYLSSRHMPVGSVEVSNALQLPYAVTQRCIIDLYLQDRIARVGKGLDKRPLWRVVEIGECDWCGTLDHHLIAGECRLCAAKSHTTEAGACN